ncbi:hypothetical protein PR003_g23768 [Phytophthora rubi]|uniref:Uncharacterized protein n=1 Tax=Phytophthora rubi TaxID=129364 RepID=A0A6A3KVX0_9STRA|nr:hypothetical protein PR001_g16860 [Phytophthora rubi]KAE9296410.1 hypothetical protein PR003_g23768 [Phytophthora rubi]
MANEVTGVSGSREAVTAIEAADGTTGATGGDGTTGEVVDDEAGARSEPDAADRRPVANGAAGAAAEAAEGSTRATAGNKTTPDAGEDDMGAGSDAGDVDGRKPLQSTKEPGATPMTQEEESALLGWTPKPADATVEVAADEDVAGEAADDGARADGGTVDADSEPSGSDIDERGSLDREKIQK